MKKELSIQQKKSDTDINVIAVVTLLAFLLYLAFHNVIMTFIENENIHILIRVCTTAFLQFSIAGLGSSIVCLYRKKTPKQLGLRKNKAGKAILFSSLYFIPHLVYIFISGQFKGYHPLSVLLLDDVLSGSLLTGIIGVLFIAVTWGFFEGFNYVIIATIIKERYPNNKIHIEAISCAIICILFHPFSTSLWGITEIITTFIFIYGIIRTADKTNNAWGCIFVFLFLWNAF